MSGTKFGQFRVFIQIFEQSQLFIINVSSELVRKTKGKKRINYFQRPLVFVLLKEI